MSEKTLEVEENVAFDTVLKEAVSSSLDSVKEVYSNEGVFDFVMGTLKDEKGELIPTNSIRNIVRLKTHLYSFMAALLGSASEEKKEHLLEHISAVNTLSDCVIANTFLLSGLIKKEEVKSVFHSLSDADLEALTSVGRQDDAPKGPDSESLFDAATHLREYLTRSNMAYKKELH